MNIKEHVRYREMGKKEGGVHYNNVTLVTGIKLEKWTDRSE